MTNFSKWRAVRRWKEDRTMPCTAGRLARFNKWKINRPSAVTADVLSESLGVASMIEHVISHLISRKVEKRVDRWVGAGRNSLPIREGDTFTLHFGARYRIQTIVCAMIFITFTSLAAWCHFFSEPLGFWLGLAYMALVLPMTVVSIYNALHALTHRIEVSHGGFLVRRVLLSDIDVPWQSVSSIRWRRLSSTILVDTDRCKRVRISTDLNGLYAFAELMSESPPGTRDKSVVDWMLEKL